MLTMQDSWREYDYDLGEWKQYFRRYPHETPYNTRYSSRYSSTPAVVNEAQQTNSYVRMSPPKYWNKYWYLNACKQKIVSNLFQFFSHLIYKTAFMETSGGFKLILNLPEILRS